MITPENETKMILERITVLQKELKEKQVVVTMEEATVNGVSFSDKITLHRQNLDQLSEVTVNGVNVICTYRCWKKSGNQEVVLLGNHKSGTFLNEGAKERSKPQESDTVMVKLLKATKVPAGHRQLVRAKVDGWFTNNLAPFTPMRIADTAVQADAEGYLKLIVENSGYRHMELEEGCIQSLDWTGLDWTP